MEPTLTEPQETEVMAKAKRRRFTAHEKLRILKEADACMKPGEQGALLRREGLYSSHLVEWRRAREPGKLDALSPRKRGRKAIPVNPLEKENTELRRALTKAEARAARAEALAELQKKSRNCWVSSCRGRTRTHDGDRQGTRPRVGHRRHLRRPRCGPRNLLPPATAAHSGPAAEEAQSEGGLCRGEGGGARGAPRGALHRPGSLGSVRDLLDEGRYLCSERTMYRILEESGEVRDRRDQLLQPVAATRYSGAPYYAYFYEPASKAIVGMRIVETIPALKPGPLLSAVQADEDEEQMRKAAMRGVPALDVK